MSGAMMMIVRDFIIAAVPKRISVDFADVLVKVRAHEISGETEQNAKGKQGRRTFPAREISKIAGGRA